MGLRDALLSAVSSAIDATGDIAETLTYVTKTNIKYDVIQGQKGATETTYAFKAIVSVAADKVAGGSIASGNTGELSIIFAAKGLTFTPKTDDIIIRGSDRHTISKIDTDPAGASYTLLIRKVG